MRRNHAAIEARDMEIWDLAAGFLTEKQIADRLDIHQSTVNRSLKKTADRRSKEGDPLDQYREKIRAQLETIATDTYRAWQDAQAQPNPKNVHYLNTNLKALERICKLYGLDAPVRIENDNHNRTLADVFFDATNDLNQGRD